MQRSAESERAGAPSEAEVSGHGRLAQDSLRLERVAALRDITLAITSTLDLRAVLDILTAKIFSLLPYSGGVIRLLNRETGTLETAAWWNLTDEALNEYKARPKGLSNAALHADGPLIIKNLLADPRTRNREFCAKNNIVSFLGIALNAKGEPLGVLSFHTKGEHEFTADEVEFITALAGHAAIAIHNAQLHERIARQAALLEQSNAALSRHLRSLEALYGVSTSLNQSLETAPVVHKALQEITGIFQFEAMRVFFYHRDKDDLHLFSAYEADSGHWARQRVFRRGEGIPGKVCDTGEPIVFENIQNDPRYRDLSRSRTAHAAGFRFLAAYPIKAKAEILGAIVFLGRSPRRLELYEDILIRSITEQLGVAVENAGLIDKLQRNLEQVRALHEVSLAVNSNLDLNSILNVLFDQAGRVIPHAAAEVRLLNKETGVLEATACRNLNVDDWKAVRAGRGLAKIVLDTKAPLAVRDVQRDPRTANPDFVRREGIASFLGVPLTVMDEVIGCFIVMTREEHDFDHEESELFSALASQAAVAIHKARLYEQVKKHAEELTKANVELKRHSLEQAVLVHLEDLALGGLDLQSLMDEAVLLVAQTLDVEYAKVLELLPGGTAFVLRAGVGWKEGLVGQATVGAEYASQAGYTLLSFEPVVVEDLSTETRFSGPALLHEHGVVSGLSVVVHGKEKPYGVLGAHTTSRRSFSQDDVHFLQSVSNLLAAAIERKQAEEALRTSEERFRLAAKATNDAMWEWNMLTDEVWWNEGPVTLFRYSPAEVKPDLNWWSERIHPEDKPRIAASVDTAIKTGQQTWRGEYRFRRADGSYADVVDRGYVTYEDGRPTRMIGCMTDITQSKLARAELESSHERLRALAAHLQVAREEERTRVAREIHDELGQAMTGLKMDLSWLRKKLPKDQDALRDKAESMLALMNTTIQSVRRISTELRPGVLDDLGLAAAIEWQIREFQKRTGINCQLAARLEDIHLDHPRSTALFRIFQETLTNIARHAHATKVKIKLEQNNGDVSLQVQDNGHGIPKSKLSDPRSLGISGMRERALLLGGEVTITGARGKGTTVTARVPVEAK